MSPATKQATNGQIATRPQPTPLKENQAAPTNTVLTTETGINLLAPDVERDTKALELTAKQYADALSSTESMWRRSMLMGSAIMKMRSLITAPLEKIIMELMNRPLGFMTDRNPNAKRASGKEAPRPYDRDTVLDCVAHGMLQGVFPFNNEMNIISGQCMIVLNGWRRKVKEIPGLEYPEIDFADPVATPMHFIVSCTARWVHNGKLGQLKRNVMVKRDQYTTTDQVIGKAERKILKAIYLQVSGPGFLDIDDDGAEVHVSQDEIDHLKAQGRLKLARESLTELNQWSKELGLEVAKTVGVSDWKTATTAQLNAAAEIFEKRIADSRPKPADVPPVAANEEESDSPGEQKPTDAPKPDDSARRRGLMRTLNTQIEQAGISQNLLHAALCALGVRGEESTEDINAQLDSLTADQIDALIDELSK